MNNLSTDAQIIFELSTDSVCMLNKNGGIENANSKFLNLLGVSGEEVIKKPFVNFVHLDDKEQTKEQFRQVLKNPNSKILDFKNRLLTQSGKTTSMSWNLKSIDDCIFVIGKNITQEVNNREESTLTMKQLNLKNEQYQLISAYLESVILTLDKDFKITFCTSFVNELLGYKEEEVINQHFFNFLNHTAIENLNERLVNHDELVLETKMFKKNQEEVCVSLKLKKINEGQLSDSQFHVNIRDITSEKNNIALLNSKQELLDTVGEMTKTGGWSIDLKTGKISWTNETYKIHDLTKEEFDPTVGEAIDYYLPEHRPIVTQIVERCIQGVSYDIEAAILSNKNVIKQVRIMGNPSYDSSGEITRIFGTIQDITESKSNEAYRQMLESVVVNVEDAVLITNADVDNLKIIYANKAITKLTGYSIGELLGKNPEILQGGNTSGEARAKIRKSISNGEGITIELLNYRKSGRPYWVEVSISPIKNLIGKVEKFVAIQRDTTHTKNRKKELENLVRQRTTELMVINKKLENFARIASHDMKTPLRSINSYLTLLHRSVGDKLTATELNFLKQSQASVVDLNNLINSILAYSKVNDASVSFEIIDLDYLVKHLVNKYFLSEAQEHEGTITYDEFPSKIIGSKPQLRQVLQNLIGNALKFKRKDVAPIINITYEEDADFHYISVKDNGIGIKIEHTAKVFEPFQRLVGKGINGHGVGLSICKEIVEVHGGTFKVNSTPNVGSEFAFSISKNLILPID